MQKETLRYEEVEQLIGPPPHGKKNLIESAEFEESISQQEPLQPEENKQEENTAQAKSTQGNV